MPLPKNDRSQRPARGKTIQAKHGKSLDKSKSDDKGNGKISVNNVKVKCTPTR